MAPNMKQQTAEQRPVEEEDEKQQIRPAAQRRPRCSALQSYIPPYLRNHVIPYHGDFCYTPIFHQKLISQLMAEGFLPIATDGLLLPKLHQHRCVIRLASGDLHVSKSARKKAKRFSLTINQAFEEVVQGCRLQHGRHCWLYDPLVAAFRTMHAAKEEGTLVTVADWSSSQGGQAHQQHLPVRLYSVEVWSEESGELVGGELGYTVGSIYTSLTGFSLQDSAGSVQLAALGRLLCKQGFTLWDLGMEMEYKKSLGAMLLPRDEFVSWVHRVRGDGHIRLPSLATPTNAKAVIDDCGLTLSA